VLRSVLPFLAAAVLAVPAHGQLVKLGKPKGPPPDATPLEQEAWPFPLPDPKSWWDDKWPKAPEAADPLGGRRIKSTEALIHPDNGVDASTYRLWGLPPLQWQLIRGDEMILEVWTRPAQSVRQTVTRVVVRGGEVFVQARAGLACCEAGIGRRIGFDAELPPGSAARFQALKSLPLWSSPRDVRVEEAGTSEAVCVEGTGYDITLAVPGRAVTVHRACDPAEVGEAADVLEAVLGAAMGHDPRFDVIFRGGANFAAARAAYRELTAAGGRLKPNPEARLTRPGAEGAPAAETGAAIPAVATPTPPAAGPR
jgi:hypothetical protein